MATPRGLAGLAFADPGEEKAALADMQSRWPKARYVEDRARTAPLARRVFDPALWRADQPLRVVLIGTDWEVRVWETLLKIPMGRVTTYSDIARKVCTEKAVARGRRRGRQEPDLASWCRATACSARAASSPAITGASRANARCSAGKPAAPAQPVAAASRRAALPVVTIDDTAAIAQNRLESACLTLCEAGNVLCRPMVERNLRCSGGVP